MFRSRSHLVIAVSAALVLAACGGGGGDPASSEAEVEAEALREQLAELEAQIEDLTDDAASTPTESESTDNGGFTDVPEPVVLSDTGLYNSPAEAETAAAAIGCEGSHEMGGQYMPCAEHGELDEIEMEVDDAAEPAEIEEVTEIVTSTLAPTSTSGPTTSTDATTSTSTSTTSPPMAEIEVEIEQRSKRGGFRVEVEAAVAGAAGKFRGIKAVCIYQYNDQNASIDGNPSKPCSDRGGRYATYDEYSRVWKVDGTCASNNRIKDYYDIGLVTEDGRRQLIRIADSPC
ncbi:MAG: hypothetical protein O3C62_10885 [Actinomycetota bacterium]|nr:hypothetical protein [Actinomycetota bacterium]MDA2972791.1 hypothetical protein [Actinomycetota bacterium]MDA3002171.1 hypothetical protein [Actinomycetota bacterium]